MLFVYIWCVSVYTHFKFNILHMYASMLYYLCMSGQFIPLSQFLSHYKKKKNWNNKLKVLKQQTCYSSVQLKKTDFFLLDRESQDIGSTPTPKELSSY